MSINTRHQKGFTLVELLVIAPIVILAVAGTVALLLGLITENAINNSENAVAAEVQTTLNEIDSSLSSSKAFLYADSPERLPDNAQSSSYIQQAFPSVSNPWRNKYIIGQTYDQVADGSTTIPAFKNTPASCGSPGMLSNNVQNTNTVYFAQDTNSTKTVLKRRILTTEPRDICGTSVFPRSCEATSTTTNCTSDDILLKDLVQFLPTYYDSNGDQTFTIADAVSAKVVIAVRKPVAGKQISYKSEIRLNLLNQ